MSFNCIKQIREQRGLTQKDLAKLLNVSQGQISQWEQSSSLTMSTLNRIAAALDCPTVFLISPSTIKDSDIEQLLDDYQNSKYTGSRLIEAFNKLNGNGKEAAVKHVEELTEIPRYQIRKK